MPQLTFDLGAKKKRRVVMISLMPEYYEQLIKGEKKYEYRRGQFIEEPCLAFAYCSSPVMTVGALAEFGQPIIGSPKDIAKIKEKEAPGTTAMMMEWMQGFHIASATPVLSVHSFPPLSFDAIRKKLGQFHPPQRFTYVDNKPELLKLLSEHSGLVHAFEELDISGLAKDHDTR